jgi:DnaK suppressor protein
MEPQEARTLLAEERATAVRRLASLTEDFDAIVAASKDTNADDEHDPEGATIAFERSQVDALVGQARRRLAEIDAALGRVDDGSYGTCVTCGRAIPDERLAARPTALTCVTCPAP